jgi:hypothetical protein
MASRTALLETIANRFLARREELAEEMTEWIRAGVAEFPGFDPAPLRPSAPRATLTGRPQRTFALRTRGVGVPLAPPAKVAKKRRVRLNSLRTEVRNA